MKISKQARREGKSLFRSTLASGRMSDDRVRQAVRQVLAAKPRGYVAILEHFQRLVKLELDRRRARIESAIALTPEQQAGVSASLERLYGGGLDFTFEQNPALIGGIRVRVGSDVYEGSVAERLHRLEEAF